MATIRNRHTNAVIISGALPTVLAEVLAGILAGVDFAHADLRGVVFDNQDISGLWAPGADFTGASMVNVTANRAVLGRVLELSSASLQGCTITGTLTHANLSCTHPTAMRAELGPNTRIRGCDWSDCPDVIVLPVRDDAVGKVIALRNGTGWKVHAGDRGVLSEAQAKVTLAARPEYAAAMTWLDSAEAVSAKAAIEARPVGTGPVVKPTAPAGGAQADGKAR